MPPPATSPDERFAAERRRLEGLAYRMLGSSADAEDVVSEAYLRWRRTDAATIRNPAAFLTTVTTRLALDRLRSAAREREHYVGPWLPEPVPTDPSALPAAGAPEDAVLLAESLTYGFLALLERLDPDERAAFLLRVVYGEDYDVVAAAIGRSPAACRQVVHRARARLRGSPRFTLDRRRAEDLADRLAAAVLTDDTDALEALLSEDVVLVSDGGGARRAARHPVVGRARVSRFLAGVVRGLTGDVRTAMGWVNNQVAFVVWVDGEVDAVLTVSIDVQTGLAGSIQTVRNPAKLRGFTAGPDVDAAAQVAPTSSARMPSPIRKSPPPP